MTRNEPLVGARVSSATSSSTESARSSITVKPLPATPSPPASNGSRPNSADSRRIAPSRLKTDDDDIVARFRRPRKGSEPQISPTGTRLALSPSSTGSNVSFSDRMSDLTNYRRELAILDPAGGRTFHNQQNNPSTGSLSQIAPWITPSGVIKSASSTTYALPTSFYNDSSDNLSVASQLSPVVSSAMRLYPSRQGQAQAETPAGSTDSPDLGYFTDERRPSVASIATTATASSQGSRASGQRGGFRKLQGFFGEEFPGRDSSESSLTQSGGKEQRSQSYSHSSRPRDRNFSNATDHTRDASPASRPRTPVPAPEVVPFLYQEADDIARYGEAPVRDFLSGPDRDRYLNDGSSLNPPKTSSSSRSGASLVHLPGHYKHRNSNEDPRTLRPSLSRDDSTNATKDRSGSVPMYSSNARGQSPTPSGGSFHKSSINEGQISPGPHKKGGNRILGRFRRPKDRDGSSDALKKLPASSKGSWVDVTQSSNLATPQQSDWASPLDYRDVNQRQGLTLRNPAFKQFKFKNTRVNNRPEDYDDHVGPTERQGPGGGTVYHLDTDLGDMEGIISRPLPLTPMDADFVSIEAERLPIQPTGPNGAWNAPDSWAVRRGDEAVVHVPEPDDIGILPRPEEKMTPYCIRVFRADHTFATLQLPLEATVQEVISQIIKKSYVTDGLEKYNIHLKKHDISRVLNPGERPLLIQKRLLQQIGYEERDRLEDLGREDNSYLCRFLFLSDREWDYHTQTQDPGFGRMSRYNHVDLSGHNLITIPILYYAKAKDIISLNLSRNLSLDLPGDFVAACENLRDIKYNNNEARKLPASISQAKKVTYLDLSNNRLEQLDKAELDAVSGLLKLNLANNRLSQLPSYFGAWKVLRTLNISSNFLEKFPAFLCELESLVDLDLSFNLISSFPDNIGQLQNLEKLVITNNRLAGVLPDSVKDLVSLRELDIKFNAISGIDVISQLPKLEILAADHNAISSFVGNFERLRSLKLNANPVTKFEIVGPAPTLKVLNLSHAQLASIDESFNHMMNLERLVLDRNYFVSLPNQIGNLKRLEHFSIANNSLGELPAEIGCLTELRVLDVRGNNIRKLPMELWWAHRLETLNASSNVLDSFPKPASRPPPPPREGSTSSTTVNGKTGSSGSLPQTPGAEEGDADATRRPSQASSSLLSVGPSPVPGAADRKSSLVSVYGKGGRKTSVISRNASASAPSTVTQPSALRKDSGLSQRLTNTFAGCLRHLYLADNQLDDDVFEQVTLLAELRVLNLSYNDISDMPQRSIKSWTQLVELYLSGNELTTLPADDLEEYSLLQVLHINGNKFTNLPADISRAKKLAVLDCGSNSLKYNISNVPFDWNWNLNPMLRYLNLSGNRRLEIKQTVFGAAAANREQYTDFNRLTNLRVLGLMDVTLTQPSIPDQSEDRRIRTSGSLAGYLPYGMADTLGKNEHLSTIDLVVPRFNSSDTETLLGLFDGQALSTGGSKIATYLHENFGHIFTVELKALKARFNETPEDALRRAFLQLNKDLVTVAIQHTEERSQLAHRGSTPMVLSREDLNTGGVATVVYLQGQELYVANVGDVQAMLIQSDGSHKMLTKKHDPAEPNERSRIRDAGGWVSRNGRLNDLLEVSRAFGYADLMPAIQAAPHVSHMTICEQDETILLATKELWEYLAPGLVVDIARSERTDLMRAAQKLRDLAMAYGATNKIMVMMISVTDLKRRNERSRLHRGQSMSWYPTHHDDAPVSRGRNKRRDGPLDSTLQRLEAEVPAPIGMIAIVFTDIKSSTSLWEMYPAAMRSAIKLHNEVMRRQLRRIGGFEVKTEGDAFMVSFPTVTSALLWTFAVQMQLLEVDWPSEMLGSVHCRPIKDKDGNLIFNGLSVRMGIHWGEPLAEPDPVTRRMDYYGPMVNKASRISAVADGGQIAVSSDFIMEIQRCLETYQDPSATLGDTSDEDNFTKSIRRELRSLSSQGFEVKEMGERKLKGLENPEIVYSLYPHALAGRAEQHNAHAQASENSDAVEKPAVLKPGSELSLDPDSIWALWMVSLRLEMLCSTLEYSGARGLQPPATELLDRVRLRGGELTEEFLVAFMEHQVIRIETCISTLSIRHMAYGRGTVRRLRDLGAPMSDVLDSVAAQLAELELYKARFGDLDDAEGSDTEQE